MAVGAVGAAAHLDRHDAAADAHRDPREASARREDHAADRIVAAVGRRRARQRSGGEHDMAVAQRHDRDPRLGIGEAAGLDVQRGERARDDRCVDDVVVLALADDADDECAVSAPQATEGQAAEPSVPRVEDAHVAVGDDRPRARQGTARCAHRPVHGSGLGEVQRRLEDVSARVAGEHERTQREQDATGGQACRTLLFTTEGTERAGEPRKRPCASDRGTHGRGPSWRAVKVGPAPRRQRERDTIR